MRASIHIPTRLADQAADHVAAFVGSWLCIGLHTVWFVVWLAMRLDINTLTLIVSLEAIYLSTIIMISQNRQGTKDRTRDDLESVEVDELHTVQADLYKINQQQLEILTMLRPRGAANEVDVWTN